MDGTQVAFYLLAGLAVATSVLVVTGRNPVASLLFLVLSFFCLAGLFVTLEAHFLAAIQILVYAGAILVLFLFVIMLLNLGQGEPGLGLPSVPVLALSALSGLAFVALLVFTVREADIAPITPARIEAVDLAGQATVGSTEAIGTALFRDFLLPFEVTSLLLLVAMVGAVVLAKRER
ncbi:MAG: NADH-quinone oxidoreductase subunit J [Gemmatimonadetes bacterium]|nr:NADH-quinone oxidoreductase subunit J [Gemmatimonadota bacterium]